MAGQGKRANAESIWRCLQKMPPGFWREELLQKSKKTLTAGADLLLSDHFFNSQAGVYCPLTPSQGSTCPGFLIERGGGLLPQGRRRLCCYSSVVEHVLGKDEVEGSSPSNSSSGCFFLRRGPSTNNKRTQAHPLTHPHGQRSIPT